MAKEGMPTSITYVQVLEEEDSMSGVGYAECKDRWRWLESVVSTAAVDTSTFWLHGGKNLWEEHEMQPKRWF